MRHLRRRFLPLVLSAAFVLAGAGWTLNGQTNIFNGSWTDEQEWVYGPTYRVYDTRPDLSPSFFRIRGPFSEIVRALGWVSSREYWEVDPVVAMGNHPTTHSDNRWGAEPLVWSRGVVADSDTDVYVIEGQTIRLPLAPGPAATARSFTVLNSGTQRVILNGGVLNLTPFAINETLRVGIASAQNHTRDTTLWLFDVTLTSASIAMIGVGLPAGAGGRLEGNMALYAGSQWFHPAGLIEIGGGDGTGELFMGGSVLAGSSQPGVEPDPRVVVNANSVFWMSHASARLSELSVNSTLSEMRAKEFHADFDDISSGYYIQGGFYEVSSGYYIQGGFYEVRAGLVVKNASLKTDRLTLGETATAKAHFVTDSTNSSDTSSLGVVTVARDSRLELEGATVDAASLDVAQGSVSVETSAKFMIGDPDAPDQYAQLLTLAGSSGSSAQLTVVGASEVTVHSNATLGGHGAATLNIADGGVLDIRGEATAGGSDSEYAGSGTISVTGAGSVLRAQNVEVGYNYFDTYGFNPYPSPTGSITVGAGGRLEIAGRSESHHYDYPWGSYTDIYNYGGELTVGKNGTLDIQDGSSQVVFKDPSIGTGDVLDSAPRLQNYGTIKGGGTAAPEGGFANIDLGPGGTLNNFGMIDVGHSPGWLTINGDLTLESTSILLMEIGGTTRGSEYDALTVTGAVTAGGTLMIAFINGFSPTDGATFDLFDFGSLDGTFETVNLPAGFDWNLEALYADGGLSLTAVPEPGTYVAWLGLAAFAAVTLMKKVRTDRARAFGQ